MKKYSIFYFEEDGIQPASPRFGFMPYYDTEHDAEIALQQMIFTGFLFTILPIYDFT